MVVPAVQHNMVVPAVQHQDVLPVQKQNSLKTKQHHSADDVIISKQWLEKYNTLHEFYKVNGHSNVSGRYNESMKLARWVRAQRQKRKCNKMDDQRIELLNKLNFDWEWDDDRHRMKLQKWMENYNKLLQFYKKHGHSEVSAKYKEDVKLGIWVRTQRRRVQHNQMSDERIRLLNQVNIDWDWDDRRIKLQKWMENYNKLLQFYKKYGHSEVPARYKEDGKLGVWVRTQRQRMNLNKMENKKLQLLNEVDFAWDPHKLSWDRKIIELKAFISKHGHSFVPLSDENIGLWVQTQRDQYRRFCTGLYSSLTAQRILELEELGFIWIVRNNKRCNNNVDENDDDNDDVDHNDAFLLSPAGNYSSVIYSYKEFEDEFPTLNNGRYKVEYC